MNRINLLLFCVCTAVILVACSDNVTEVQVDSYENVPELDQKFSKKSCNFKNIGELLFAASSPQNFVCDGSVWVPWSRPKNDQKSDDRKDLCSNGSYDPSRQMCDSRDGQVYLTVQIGEQTWMAENLNYELEDLPDGTPRITGSNLCYEDKPENCRKYGRLYTWAEVIDSVAVANNSENSSACGYGRKCSFPKAYRGICPDGWHLPDSTEWKTLLDFTGEEDGGRSLRATDWNLSDGWAGTDAYGFSALPAGLWLPENNAISGFGKNVSFWSASDWNDQDAFGLFMDANGEWTVVCPHAKVFGHPVRCLKD